MKIGLFICTIIFFVSCKKNNASTNNCDENAPTQRVIVNKKATITLLNGEYFIVEENTIDTKLSPCNLPLAFKNPGLNVIVSGSVKQGISSISPCCTNAFIISNIYF